MKHFLILLMIFTVCNNLFSQSPTTSRDSLKAGNVDTTDKHPKSFWIEIGANFDLVDGLEPNNFFSGVFFHKRDIRKFSKKDTTNNVGIFAGIFESKTITSLDEQNYAFRPFYDTTSFTSNTNTFKVYNGVGTYTTKRIASSVSLFFSPQLRISNRSANEDGLHFFTSIWMELQWQRVSEDRTYKLMKVLDTVDVSLSDIVKYDAQNFKSEADIRTHYLGLGLPILYREFIGENRTQLFINPVLGMSNQPPYKQFQEILYAGSTALGRRWRPFYIIQFRLNEEKYGISFTGEVRGLLGRNNPPFVSLALSKKFDLTKFIEFTGK